MVDQQWELETAAITFYPPLYKRTKGGSRRAILTTRTGRILKGITVCRTKAGFTQVVVPAALTTHNRPEQGNPKVPVHERASGVLRQRVQEAFRVKL